METQVLAVLVDALYLLALINPMSKVSVLSVLASAERRGEFRQVAARSTLVAGGILLGSMVFGSLILQDVFHVEIHSLRLAGGAVLCWVGFNALRRGVFFEQETSRRFEDMALVPLACPMIAGPATIAACIALRAKEGLLLPALSLILALAVNHLIMCLAQVIAAALTRFNVLGALIRITGLVVMTIGTQMALDGLAAWLAIAR
jgi:multiple antibiotic resistance protein